jgi:hypothetical protein
VAYVHCHSCGWSQDDFYSVDGYNPAWFLLFWMKELCSENIDQSFSNDSEFLRENGDITTREVIAREFEEYAQRIRNMRWVTYEQWKKDPDRTICPECGQEELDID